MAAMFSPCFSTAPIDRAGRPGHRMRAEEADERRPPWRE